LDLRDAIRQRRAVRDFDPAREITDAELRTLLEETILSPSSFNLQNWRFLIVRDAERKKRLCEMAWGQRQVQNAGAVILVLGNLKSHRGVQEIYAEAPPDVQERLVPLIRGFYQGNPELQRDEAIRSGSLAAMTLMLTAETMGLSTCAMIGFDPDEVCAYLGIDDVHVPVMMVCLGGKMKDGWVPPRLRLPLDKLVMLEEFGGPPLPGA
jgi:nitroreductase